VFVDVVIVTVHRCYHCYLISLVFSHVPKFHYTCFLIYLKCLGEIDGASRHLQIGTMVVLIARDQEEFLFEADVRG
jgi:hypothetical protein